jgi:ribosomal protein L22
LTEEYLRRKTEQRSIIRGGLSSSSIFEDEALAGPKPQSEANRERVRNPDSMAAALDPDPVGRRLWERKMVIKTVRKRGRLTRTQVIKQSERELVSRSRDIQGSVKKLVPLAKQIAGKTVDEAIIQMRFSKKKAAKYIKEHLEYARNEAIVKRGMGLGARAASKTTPVQIKTKDGKKVKVTDPTTIYVDQAWTGKGFKTLTPDYRARGRISLMKNRHSSKSIFCYLKPQLTIPGVTLLLKEEKTRIRLHNERENKIKNRKVWVQLPNRPIPSQRPHYSW